MIETRRICVIAMSHITEATAAILFRTPLAQWPVKGAPMGCDGLMIYAHTETFDREIPADVRDVITWARAQMPPGATPDDPGYEFILLDNDAEPVAGLHDYCAHERAAPELLTYSCNMRAKAHLTATVEVQAFSIEDAEKKAFAIVNKRGFAWEVSDPEDVQFESTN